MGAYFVWVLIVPILQYMQEHGESIQHSAMNCRKFDVCKIYRVGIEAKLLILTIG